MTDDPNNRTVIFDNRADAAYQNLMAELKIIKHNLTPNAENNANYRQILAKLVEVEKKIFTEEAALFQKNST